MPTRLCVCGTPIPLRTSGSGRQRQWCTKECRNRNAYAKSRAAAGRRAPQRRAWALPPYIELADNVTAELDDRQWPVDIAGRRSLTVGRLCQLLIAGGYPGVADRLTHPR